MTRVASVNNRICASVWRRLVPIAASAGIKSWLRDHLTLWLMLTSLVGSVGAQGEQAPSGTTTLASEQVINRVAPAVALILVGQGGGRLMAQGTGVIVREHGVLLTAYHLLKDAHEVQVRLKSGEVYDRVELLGFDERRDVVALRIPARGLPALSVADAEVGQRVYVVSNPAGLSWTVADGLLSALRLADEVKGAGSGYQLLQFTAPVAAGSSGGALVDAQARLLGVIVGGRGQNLNFAVPINSVAGLADIVAGRPLGSGSELRPPAPELPPSSQAVIKTDPAQRLRELKTLYVRSSTSYFAPVQLLNVLRTRPEWAAWQLLFVDDVKVADAIIEIDRPLFTFIFTFNITDKRTSVLLASGTVTAWDGNLAAPGLAKEIIKQFKVARPLPANAAAK